MINHTTIKTVSVILLLTLLSCKNDKNNENDKSITIQSKDNWKYKHLKGKFFTDKHGKLFEQKAYAVAGRGETLNAQIYFDSIVSIVTADKKIIEKSLSEVIDIKTYTEFDIGTMYSKDKNNVYYSNATISGDYRLVVTGANPKTFKPLSDYLYGMDNKNIYYRGDIIQGLNFSKHKILHSLDPKDCFIDYIIDDKVVFYDGDTLKGADAKTFKLVTGQKWEAEDKNYKYKCCGQRFE